MALIIRNYLCFFLCFAQYIVSIQSAPYFPIHEHPKIEISAENRDKHMNGKEILKEESLRIQNELAKRRFPWEWLMIFSFILLLGLGIYMKRGHWLPLLMAYLYPKKDPLEEIQSTLLSYQTAKALPAFLGIGHLVREYLELIYDLHLESDSTIEIVQIVHNKMDRNALIDVAELLHDVDYVKFAGFHPTEEQKSLALSKAQALVQQKK